jgi:hypothetical protein
MGAVNGASIVWYIEDATPRGEVRGTPIIVAPGTFLAQGQFKSPEVWIGNYGWPDE